MIDANFQLIVVGHTSGKMSWQMLERLTAQRNVVHYRSFNDFQTAIDSNVKHYNHRSFILPIYCEDADLVRPFNISLATSIESLISKRKIDATVLHSSRIGNIIGNKIRTNKFLTENAILCPQILLGDECSTTAFVNEVCGSGVHPTISNKLLDPTKYNTKFIDTTYRYKNKEYWTAIRAMCVGSMINEIYVFLREKDYTVGHLNASVHAYDSPKCSEIHNAYYNDIVRPMLAEIKQICFNIGKLFGTGFYSHDMLIGNDENVYVSECGFKADSPTWKKYSKEFAHELLYEYPYNVSIERSIDLLMINLATK